MKSEDFETNERGTLNALMLKDMALRSVLEYIDLIDVHGIDSVEAIEQRKVVDQFREEL